MSGNTRQDYAYTYDLVGNIVEMDDRTPGCGIVGSGLGADALNRAFIYDPLYRLLTADGRENLPSAAYPWWDDSYRSDDNSTTSAYTQNYTYDKIGNILELAHTAASSPNNFTRTFDYGASNNFLNGITVGTGIGTYTYDYDEVGNQIKENTTRNYEWDHSNNMRCFYNQAGTSEPTIYVLYLYSGGQRVKKLVRTSGGGYESFSYISDLYEYKSDGTDEQCSLKISTTATLRTGDAMGDTTPTIKYNLEDVLGSSMTLLDDTGSWVNREEYYPFGETSFGSYALKRYRFQGKEKDSESGLYYFGARYYCAASCRFISVDPQLYPNQSTYCGFDNNPINKTDPTGMGTDGTGDPPNSRKVNGMGGQITIGDNLEISEDKTEIYHLEDGHKVVNAVWNEDTKGYIDPKYSHADKSFEQLQTEFTEMNMQWDAYQDTTSGPGIGDVDSGDMPGQIFMDVMVTPALNTADFTVTTPQFFVHAFQQGLAHTEEKDQKVWTVTRGWLTEGSPELEEVQKASQGEVAEGIVIGGLTGGVAEFGGPIVSKLFTKWVSRLATKGVGQLGFKEVQALTKTYSTELNAFFKSGGTKMASKDALLSYKELATRILNGTGGAPTTKLTETALKVQSQRLEMINKALETFK